jgi:lipoprotein NlpI
LGRHNDAADTFRQAILMKPEEFWPHMNLGRAYFALEQYKKSIEELREAIRIDPKFADAYVGLGLAYIKVANYEEAIEAFSQLIRLRPQEANAFRSRSFAHLYLAHGEAAAADAQKYLELSGGVNKSDLYMVLAAHFGYRQVKREGDAARVLEEASTKADPKRWPYPVVRYLRDEITAQELLTQATDGDKKTEAQAYIGMDLSLAGKPIEALIYLQWVQENGNKNFVEYSLALSEIKRIKALKESTQP